MKSTNVSNNKESFIIFKIQRKTVQLLKRNMNLEISKVLVSEKCAIWNHVHFMITFVII